MIIVKIKAGLGNQMFQYALGRRLSLDWNDELKFDLSWFGDIRKGEIPRDLGIDGFNVVLNKATKSEVAQLAPNFFVGMIDRVRGRLNRTHFYRFYPRLLKNKKSVFLDGFFQSYKYFDSIREVLLKDFTLKNGFSKEADEFKNEIKRSGQSVGMHIRRGDFAAVNNGYNGLCDVTYYQKALGEINKKYADIKLFIFSDDIQWVKENLKFINQMIFVSNPTLSDAEELLLMSLCKHQIIANSTFSWWGAWLNKNPEKIIVAPSRWLVVADINTNDLLPPDWIRM